MLMFFVLLSSEPRAFDEWRLYQYFESIGIEKIDDLSNLFDVCDEDGTAELINCLLGVLPLLLEPRFL